MERTHTMTTTQIKIESSHIGLHIAKSRHGPVLVLWEPEEEYVDALKKLEGRLGTECNEQIREEFERGIRALAETHGLYVGDGMTDGHPQSKLPEESKSENST